MLASLQNGRPTLARLAWLPASQQVRAKSAGNSASILVATSDVARRLKATGVWRSGGRRPPGSISAIEPRRVNVVSEGLCDDIIKYLAPSLERHRGCDLIGLNPGAGLWSQRLHNFLEPRKHVMMDNDAELYRPFLSDLLSKKNVTLVPKAGFVWKDLLEVLRHHFPNQTRMKKDATPVRNDTLLVTANLSIHPKKPFHGFESISTMVIYQFISSIRTSSLIQKYGLVRMLFWINDEDKKRVIPHSIFRRRRSAFEGELSCEWIHEVAGLDTPVQDRVAMRDEWVNMESGFKTLERMKAQGLKMPSKRETALFARLRADPDLMGHKLAGVRPPMLPRPFKKELEDFERVLGGKLPDDREQAKRLKILRQRDKNGSSDSLVYLDLLQQREAASKLAFSSPDEFQKADEAWNERVDNLKKNARNEFIGLRDGYHIFRQDPPVLLWDRRAIEPLSAHAHEFFPNAPTALMDIQPKAVQSVFRQYGPMSSRSGDIADIILPLWLHQTLLPINKAMHSIWAGFGDVISECPSVTDPRRGGTPLTGHGALTVRAMNEAQWTEVMEAWMRWPFRPTYQQILGRLVDDVESDIEEDEMMKAGSAGLTF